MLTYLEKNPKKISTKKNIINHITKYKKMKKKSFRKRRKATTQKMK